jgi:hypothetical protein
MPTVIALPTPGIAAEPNSTTISNAVSTGHTTICKILPASMTDLMKKLPVKLMIASLQEQYPVLIVLTWVCSAIDCPEPLSVLHFLGFYFF